MGLIEYKISNYFYNPLFFKEKYHLSAKKVTFLLFILKKS